MRLLTTPPSDQQQPIPTKLCMSFDRLAVNFEGFLLVNFRWQQCYKIFIAWYFGSVLWNFVFCIQRLKKDAILSVSWLQIVNYGVFNCQILHLTLGLLSPFRNGHNILYAIAMTTCKDIVKNIPMTPSYSWLYLGDRLWFPADTCRNTNNWEWNPEH